MSKVLIFAVLFAARGAVASPSLLDTDERQHGGWLLAQADTQVVVTTTDGQVVSGTLIEDVAGGVMVRTGKGENVFIERARVNNLAHTLGERALPPPGRAEPLLGLSASGRSKESLKAELSKLLAERPAVGGGVTMIALGGIGLIAGLICLLPATILLNTGYATNQNWGIGFLVSGLIEIVVGAVLLITGIVVVKEVGARRRLYNEKIEELERELKRQDDIDRGRTQVPPPALVPTQLAAFQRGF